MAITSFFKRNWIHFAAIGIFLLISVAYFSKQLQGYGLKQHDIAEHKGISREIAVYREHNNGQEPLWSNGMFGGMPSMQTSTIYHGNWFSETITGFIKVFPSPLGIVFFFFFFFKFFFSWCVSCFFFFFFFFWGKIKKKKKKKHQTRFLTALRLAEQMQQRLA